MLNIISLGAGVQSSTMALMAAHEEITPMPDCAIFADTQGEPKAVYEWANWLEKQLPFPVHKVTAGSLEEDSLILRKSKKSGSNYIRTLVPFFTKNKDGSKGILRRKCTTDYKLNPLFKKIREVANIKYGEKEVRVISWIGISTDEAHRQKISRNTWAGNRYPLIEENMTRGHCLEWMKKHYPNNTPPRSACTYCPYHSNKEWRNLTKKEFQDAVDFEKKVQEITLKDEVLKGTPFLHNSCVPLNEVDLDSKYKDQINMFGNECEGMCGV